MSSLCLRRAEWSSWRLRSFVGGVTEIVGGPGGDLGARVDTQLQADVGDVCLHRPAAEEEVSGDATVRLTPGHEPGHLALATGQSAGRPLGRAGRREPRRRRHLSQRRFEKMVVHRYVFGLSSHGGWHAGRHVLDGCSSGRERLLRP
jgi:hypothetical protein